MPTKFSRCMVCVPIKVQFTHVVPQSRHGDVMTAGTIALLRKAGNVVMPSWWRSAWCTLMSLLESTS